MISSTLVQPQHLDRRAVIYVRQSSPQQVLTNLESGKLQRAMREHARRLGWPDERIVVVDSDTGNTAKTTAGRDAYKNLLADVAIGNVGIVLSYETTRLARNCSDWYPLLDVCALKHALIADRDGVYDPASVNGRMMLGMKGIISELELHTLRGRLTAGLRSKAERGELALALPAGLFRQDDNQVVKDPDVQVQEAIDLVFRSFLELKTACKVRDHLRRHHVKLPRRHRNAETVWRKPTTAAVLSILKNPAYAGAFAYGKTQSVRTDPQSSPSQRRRAMEDWTVLIRDRHPAYVTWENFERIQAVLLDNYAEYKRNMSRGVPREGSALLQGLAYCGECGRKLLVSYKGGTRYLCQAQRVATGDPTCQYIPADAVDQRVVDAFFEALSPVELDLYEAALRSRHDAKSDVDVAQDREVQRLRYQADLARRRYERIDPDNRLVAGELERRWELALRSLREAKDRIDERQRERDKVVPLSIPRDLRAAFESFGQSLPDLWQKDTLTRAQRKALLRCLIDKVVLKRTRERWDYVQTRVVWRGGAVSELEARVNVGALQDLSDYDDMVARVLALEAEGLDDERIADALTRQGFKATRIDHVPASTVGAIRREHGRLHRYKRPRPRRVDGFLTVPQVSAALGVKAQWLYHKIHRGAVQVQRDSATRMYLFPDRPEVLDELGRLRDGQVDNVSV